MFRTFGKPHVIASRVVVGTDCKEPPIGATILDEPGCRRTAVEIRLNRPIDEANFYRYAAKTHLSPMLYDAFREDRARTWRHVVQAELTCAPVIPSCARND